MNKGQRMRQAGSKGFTLIELMIVVAIISILATMAVPSFQDRVIKAQVSEGIGLSAFVKEGVAAYYAKNHALPKDNAAAGLPPARAIVGNFVNSVAVQDGAVVITYGNQSNRHLSGRAITLRPATVPDYPVVPIAWVCAGAGVPAKMTVHGADRTTVLPSHLPLDCHAGPA